MLAYAILGLQRRTFGSALRYAIANELWEDALGIFTPLDFFCDARGMTQEADTWGDLVRLATEDLSGNPPRLGTPAGVLWALAAIRQANRQRARHHLDEAERLYNRIRSLAEAQVPSGDQQGCLADVYHQLGRVAQDRGQLDAAEDWYRQSLAAKKRMGGDAHIASTYHQIGMVAQDRGQFDRAEYWLRKSLAIETKVGNQTGVAKGFHQLGIVAQDRGRLGEAEDWYRKALVISERLADKTGEAAVYHQFGGISQRQDRLDDAEHWYRRALVIEEEQRDKPHIALTCHNLGTVAYGKGRLDDAEAWFHKALAIYTGLGDKPHTVGTSEMLGQLAEARGRVDQALEWTIRGVAAFAELPRSLTEPGRKHLALLAARLGLVAVEECWRKVTGDPLPTAVREYIESSDPQDERASHE